MSEERQTPPLFMDNLHPLESKVLLALAQPQSAPPTLDQLTSSTGLEPSQLSMAVEWLLAKSLIAVHAETVAHIASLTPTGEAFFDQSAPIERVLSAAREAGQTGKRLTIQDIQSQEQLEPSDVSKAVGTLKKEGAILIVQGGCIESTGRNSPTAEAMRTVLQELRSGQRDLETFAEPLRSVLQQHAVKREMPVSPSVWTNG
jgi:phenylalanyl-tRNA synthetase alpha chain